MAAERRFRNRRLAEDPRRLAREDSARRRRTILVAAFAGVFVLVLAGILIAGYVIKFVLPPREVIIQVNDVVYTRGDLVKLVRVQQRGADFLGFELETATEVFQVLQNLLQNEIMIQSAPQFGVTVTGEEIDHQIRSVILRRATYSDPEQAEREFKELYSGYLNAIQLSEQEHRETTRRSLTREKLVQFMGETVARVGPHVRVYRLVMYDNQEFDVMEEKYAFATEQASTPEEYIAAFRDVAREFSQDAPDVVRKNGEIGWTPRGIMPDYEDLLFGLQIGELSERVPDFDTEGVNFYFMVAGKQEARDLADTHWHELKSKALTDWVNKHRVEFEVFSTLNSDVYDWVLLQLGFSEPPEIGARVLRPPAASLETG